jgi:hypothetical protein
MIFIHSDTDEGLVLNCLMHWPTEFLEGNNYAPHLE